MDRHLGANAGRYKYFETDIFLISTSRSFSILQLNVLSYLLHRCKVTVAIEKSMESHVECNREKQTRKMKNKQISYSVSKRKTHHIKHSKPSQ